MIIRIRIIIIIIVMLIVIIIIKIIIIIIIIITTSQLAKIDWKITFWPSFKSFGSSWNNIGIVIIILIKIIYAYNCI